MVVPYPLTEAGEVGEADAVGYVTVSEIKDPVKVYAAAQAARDIP